MFPFDDSFHSKLPTSRSLQNNKDSLSSLQDYSGLMGYLCP